MIPLLLSPGTRYSSSAYPLVFALLLGISAFSMQRVSKGASCDGINSAMFFIGLGPMEEGIASTLHFMISCLRLLLAKWRLLSWECRLSQESLDSNTHPVFVLGQCCSAVESQHGVSLSSVAAKRTLMLPMLCGKRKGRPLQQVQVPRVSKCSSILSLMIVGKPSRRLAILSNVGRTTILLCHGTIRYCS